MLKHYWITAVRNLVRNKMSTSINIIGLSISIAIFLTLTGYVAYQFSYDKFYSNGNQIYRIDYYEYQDGQAVLQSARTHDRTALIAGEYVPQIEATTRVYDEKAFVFTEDVRIVDQNMLFVDSSFFKVFDVKIVSGSADRALVAPHTVMISQSQAQVYFGNTDPIGKILYFNERLAFTVTGVFEDIPANSSIDYDFLLSWSTMVFNGWVKKEGDFGNPYTFTFVKLREQAPDLGQINNALTDIGNKHITSLEKRRHTARMELRPYEDLHTASGLSGEIKPGISKTLLYVLISLGLFLLVAAWVNYINLSLARSLERADEIGVRKVFGATRTAISKQFLLEALILSVVTFGIGYGLYVVFTGPLAGVFFNNLTFLPDSIFTNLLYFTGFVAGTTLVAFYPALFISKYKPAVILKNKLGVGRGGANLLHQGLMIFQLFLAVASVGITLIAERQVKFMREFDSGFNTKQTITLRAPASTNSDSLRQKRFFAFRDEVLQNPAFKAGVASMNIPGQEIRFHEEGVHAVGGASNEKQQMFWVMWVDEGYQQTFGMNLIAGRNFRQQEPADTCMINEAAALALGYQEAPEAVNTKLILSGSRALTIAGIWKDYHHQSARKSVDPIIFVYQHPFEYGYYSFLVQSRSGNYLETLERIWKQHYPQDQFIYYFMDSFFEAQYREDELFAHLLTLFSVISITVASLGLFGMTSLAMVKRTKEIGVRKVLGASVWNILLLLSKNYVRLIVISCVFAFPLSWYLTWKWLQGFSYKISVQWWMIVLPGIVVLATTLFTIAWQTVRAAAANPAKSLKDE